jgi:hypothetical protein
LGKRKHEAYPAGTIGAISRGDREVAVGLVQAVVKVSPVVADGGRGHSWAVDVGCQNQLFQPRLGKNLLEEGGGVT